MTSIIRYSLAGLLILCTAALPIAAQSSVVSLTVSVGVAHGGGGDPTMTERNVPALNGLLALRSPGSRALFGLAAGVQGFGDNSLVCDLRPDGGCAQHYPDFAHLAALGGWQLASDAGGALRVMAGPGFVLTGAGFGPTGSGRAAFAVHALADLSTPPLWHLALVASAHTTLVPSFRGDHYEIGSLGLGVRFLP